MVYMVGLVGQIKWWGVKPRIYHLEMPFQRTWRNKTQGQSSRLTLFNKRFVQIFVLHLMDLGAKDARAGGFWGTSDPEQ